MSSTDTIIIGGGHNGLICATLLAKAGQKVVLVEAADTLGGLARDREFYPGFKASGSIASDAFHQMGQCRIGVLDSDALGQGGDAAVGLNGEGNIVQKTLRKAVIVHH